MQCVHVYLVYQFVAASNVHIKLLCAPIASLNLAARLFWKKRNNVKLDETNRYCMTMCYVSRYAF